MKSSDDHGQCMDRYMSPSPPLEEAEVRKIVVLRELSSSFLHFVAPTPPRLVMDPATAPRFLKKLY